MENTILSGLLDEFCEDFAVRGKECKRYEHLINYLIVNRIQPEAVETTEQILSINVDDGGNFGIDGIGIFVNDILIRSQEELLAFSTSKSNEVNFTFVQTKTSANIDTGEILKFFKAVQAFFQAQTNIPESDLTKKQRTIKEQMFKRDFAKNNSKHTPICTMYYAFTGKNLNEKTVLEVIELEKDNILRACPEIKNVNFIILDSDRTISLYNESTNSLEIDISFKNRILIENINGVEDVYSGFLEGNELLKLIEDETNNIRKNIFYENVRDYLGDDNPVNQEIIATLKNDSKQQLFPLLNNGITVIAKYIKPITGNKFIIKDYQIVNGCQTSNVLHKFKGAIKDINNFLIPVKIIYTNDSEIIEQIIRANNKQSVVPDEAFIALDKFHKQLQEYYKQASKKLELPLFYERRSREFSNKDDLNITKNQIITLHSQIRAYVSVYLNEPHLIYSNNPTFILKTVKKNLFLDTDSYAPYYVSAYIIFKIRELIRTNHKTYSQYHNFIYYFGFLFRVLATNRFQPHPISDNKNNLEEQKKIIEIFDNEQEKNRVINCCKQIIDSVVAQNYFKNMTYQDISATTAFESAIKSELHKFLH